MAPDVLNLVMSFKVHERQTQHNVWWYLSSTCTGLACLLAVYECKKTYEKLQKHHLYVSVNWVRIRSGNGLAPVRRQAITLTNAGLSSIGPPRANFSEIRNSIIFIDENVFESIVCQNGGHFVQERIS